MRKQEEVFYILQDVRLGNLSEYEATLKLQELGVVIKVERELPDWKEADCIGGGAKLAQQDMLDNNWRCVESLLDKDNPV